MQLTSFYDSPGEHAFLLQGVVGQLEAVLTVPTDVKTDYFAFLGHPHSLQGGSMNNKVVTTLARAFKELGVPSLRFNFRGVGLSEGEYDAGIGESEDLLVLIKRFQNEKPTAKIILAGFSFGSYVTYRAAGVCKPSLLISIAPPVHHYNYHEFDPAPYPWLIVQGDVDEVVPVADVVQFAQNSLPPVPVIHFPDTGHFFHGQLIKLKQQVMDYLQSQVLHA
jgi:uncharacterized protein